MALQEPREVSDTQGVSFNMALSTLARIDALRKRGVDARVNRDYVLWCDMLDCQFGELVCIANMKAEEVKEVNAVKTAFYKLMTEHNYSGSACRERKDGKQVVSRSKCLHVQGSFFWALDVYENALNLMYSKYKVMMAGKDDPSVAFRKGRG